MRSYEAKLALLGVLALTPGPLVAQRTAQDSDERAAVRAARLAQNDAIARRDLARVASYWAPDVSIRAGLGRAITGRQAYLAAFAADSSLRYERIPTEIVVSEHWPVAYEQGRWTGRLASSAGDAPLLSGRYSAQWLKSGGRWLIRSEVFVAIDCSGEACRWPASQP